MARGIPIDRTAPMRDLARCAQVGLTTWVVALFLTFLLLLARLPFRSGGEPVGWWLAASVFLLGESTLVAFRLAIRRMPVLPSAGRERIERLAAASAWLVIIWVTAAADSWSIPLLLWPWFLAIESAVHRWARPRTVPPAPASTLSDPEGLLETEELEPTAESTDRQVEQELRRTAYADGRTVVEGRLQAVFEPRQRLSVQHVAFCPPLPERPDMEAYIVDGEEGDVRVTEIECYGARIELRRSAQRSADRRSLTVQWEAVCATATER